MQKATDSSRVRGSTGTTSRTSYTPSELGEFVVSYRPGLGTVPTVGDLARWIRWSQAKWPPRDWLIADGRRFRSVPSVVDALKSGTSIPDEAMIPGDWWSPDLAELESRRKIRANWADTKRRNARFPES